MGALADDLAVEVLAVGVVAAGSEAAGEEATPQVAGKYLVEGAMIPSADASVRPALV